MKPVGVVDWYAKATAIFISHHRTFLFMAAIEKENLPGGNHVKYLR